MYSRGKMLVDMCEDADKESLPVEPIQSVPQILNTLDVPSTSKNQEPPLREVSNDIFTSEDDIFDHSSDEYIPPSQSDSDDESENSFTGQKKKRIPVLSKIIRGSINEVAGNQSVVAISGTSDTEPGNVMEKKSRKRMRNPGKWSRNTQKKKITEGAGYVTSKGKVKPAKTVKQPCNCRKKCQVKFKLEDRENIFINFYKLTREAQNQYIASNIEEYDKKSEKLRRTEGGKSRRNYTRRYYLTKESRREEVCQKMFLNTLDITLKKARIVVEKKRTNEAGICSEDKRGRHDKHPCVPDEDVKVIKDHINMFPAYQSHYSRSHTNKKYLSPDLSISKMFRLYVQYCNEKKLIPRSASFYRQIFTEHFNLDFKKPYVDTCSKCDRYEMVIKSTNDEEKSLQAKREKDEHLLLADSAYEEKRKDKERCKKASKVATISFDLQKCLPTPQLKSGISFYKRQLWTLNLTLYETKDDISTPICYLWDETVAARGGEEIASCLFKYIAEIPNEIEEINFYSDCCPGQNRNIIVAVMFLYTVSTMHNNGRSIIINHKFLEPGHTHMEADSIHAIIEKTRKTTAANIELPRDWATLIQMISRRPPIKVVQMLQSNFLNFKKLLETTYVHRTKNTGGESVTWLKIKWMRYEPDQPGKIQYKYSFDHKEEFKIIDLTRRTRSSVTQTLLNPITDKPLKLSEKKLQDLISLKEYIHPNSRIFYEALLGPLEGDPDIQSDHLVSDSEED